MLIKEIMKYFKTKKIVFLLFLINLVLSNCTSFSERYRNSICESGKPEVFAIHNDPVIGDYTILSDTNVLYNRYIIEKIEENKIYIQQSIFIENQYAPKLLQLKINSESVKKIV